LLRIGVQVEDRGADIQDHFLQLLDVVSDPVT